MTTQPTEALFNDATVSVEVSEPVLEIVAEEPIVEETIIEEPTIEEFVAEEPIQVVAEVPNTTSEGFLSRILKAKPAEKTSEVKQEVAPKQEVKTVTAQVAEQPVAKPALQVSRTVYPDADTTTGNRFKGQETIYDRLRQQSNPTVADRLSAKPVGDLKKSIGINERFTLINELFGGNQQLFMESIDKINNVNAYEEARKVLYEELAGNLKWNTEGNTFHVLDELVKRRFNG
jgi:hypothetical protein